MFLKESLEEWTKPGINGEDFLVENTQMDWEIYDLLGYEGLTEEIVEHLRALLTANGEFRPVQLFKRLENFYLRWCDGEFIDALQDNYPQKKMRQLQGQEIKTGVRQVDVYAGLNVMILLLELHRYAQSRDDLKAQIVFYPCGRKNTKGCDEFRLLRIIGYSHCVGVEAFLKTVGRFLSGAYLRSADLSFVDLSRADLSGAYLRSADLSFVDLSDADLSGANLSFADLSGAYLSRANLSGANLSGAFLGGANLRDADLSDADLNLADLRRADLSDANLENISWGKNTKWDSVQELDSAKNLPKALKQHLGLS